MTVSPGRQHTYDVIVTREVLGIRRKPKKRRQDFPRIRLLSVPMLLGIAAALFHLLTAPAYTVHGAKVRGNTLIEAQAIYQTSMVDGQNLFLLNTQAAAAAIERLPYVKRAQVRVRPPAQVAIIVQEYQPRWVWIAGDNRFWIDETGNILPDSGTLEEALTVVDPSGRPLPVGSSLEPHFVAMLDALSHLMPGLRQVSFDRRMGFILSVGPGWPVRIGEGPNRLSVKIGILNSLVPELIEQNQDVDFIDLRYPEQPYYRLKAVGSRQ
ncbi:MAG: cell division protein FtsQ/DivIB [Anaerolineae bacterium]